MGTKVKKEAKPAPKKAVANAVNTTRNMEGPNLCEHCGKPATIMSPQGRYFCDLSCQTNYGD